MAIRCELARNRMDMDLGTANIRQVGSHSVADVHDFEDNSVT